MAKIKIKAGQAIFATLDLVLEMSAKQMAFQEFMVTYFCENDIPASKVALLQIQERADYNLELLRTKILQYSEIDLDDLMNGGFEF